MGIQRVAMNNFGIMFHHFHDEDKHIVSQGSISHDDLINLIHNLKKEYEILDADVFLDKANGQKLEPNQICLTFDDALASQYDIAYPVLEEFGIKAFWFIYTSIFTQEPEKLEIYRHFRHKCFGSIDSFYTAFFKAALSCASISISRDDIEKEIEHFDPNSYKQQFSFYSDSDKLYRYLRDIVLGKKNYSIIMDELIDAYKYDIEANRHLYWVTKEQVLDLYKHGHIIGMHSHSHATTMSEKSYDEQMYEYQENKRLIKGITGGDVLSVSYPCNSYNNYTDMVMRELGILLGFDAVMTDELLYDTHDSLHFPRQNHTYISGNTGHTEGVYENFSLYL